jgi:hypothetical protein
VRAPDKRPCAITLSSLSTPSFGPFSFFFILYMKKRKYKGVDWLEEMRGGKARRYN